MNPHITMSLDFLPNSFAACLGLTLVWSLPAVADDLTPRPTMGEILRLDPAADTLLSPDAKIEMLASGLDWSEGPVWVPKNGTQPGGGGYLLFSDVPRNHVMKWKEGEGLSLFLQPSGYTGLGEYSPEPGSNGLNLNSKGELVSCEHGDRRLSVLTRGGGKRTLADNFEGKRFNSPNDLTLDKAGNIYFTDPPYGLPKGPQDTETREIPWNGIYSLVRGSLVSMGQRGVLARASTRAAGGFTMRQRFPRKEGPR